MAEKLQALGKKAGATPPEKGVVLSNEGRLFLANKVVRKVNDGFEVHPAGSLKAVKELKDFGTREPSDTGFSLDVSRQPRKLQRRDRSRSRDSRVSFSRSSKDEEGDQPKTPNDKPGMKLSWTGLKNTLLKTIGP